MKFNSLKELNAYAKKQMEDIARTKLNDIVMEALREFVVAKVYHAYFPKEYQRTHELLNSITIGETKDDGKTITASIYFDADKIVPNTNPNWSQHASVYNYEIDEKYNEPINEMIPYYMNYGTDSPVFSHQPALFLEETIKSLNSGLLRSELIKFLKQRGITAK